METPTPGAKEKFKRLTSNVMKGHKLSIHGSKSQVLPTPKAVDYDKIIRENKHVVEL